MSLVVKLLFSLYIVYRQKHLSVLAVIYPSLTCIVFPLNPIRTHSTAAGHPCHIFNASIRQPVTEIGTFFYTSKAQLTQWRSVIVTRTRFEIFMGGKNPEVRKMLPSPSPPLRILIRLLIYLFL